MMSEHPFIETVEQDMSDACRVASREVATRYKPFTTPDDLQSEALVWCYSRPEKVNEYLNRPEAGRRRAGFAALHLSLVRHLTRKAREEKATMSGYRPEDEYWYTRGDIARLLPTVLAGGEDGYERDSTDINGCMSAGDPAEGGGTSAMLADVSKAWDACPSDLLVDIYVKGMTDEQLAEVHDVSRMTIWRREQKAYDRMIKFLGGRA